MIRAVIDTNVLVSAMISSAGNEALLLMAISQGVVAPCFSAEILEEYTEVLLRPRFSFPRSEVRALVNLLRLKGHDLGSICPIEVSPDPDDDKFIACVLAAKAQFLVTGNKKHFPADQLGGAKLVNAAELLEIITSEI